MKNIVLSFLMVLFTINCFAAVPAVNTSASSDSPIEHSSTIPQRGELEIPFYVNDRLFRVYAPSGEFAYSMKPGDYIQRNFNGQVTCVGDVYISYNYNGQVSCIGDVYISYDYNGQVTRVGGLYISYDYYGNITRTSGSVR